MWKQKHKEQLNLEKYSTHFKKHIIVRYNNNIQYIIIMMILCCFFFYQIEIKTDTIQSRFTGRSDVVSWIRRGGLQFSRRIHFASPLPRPGTRAILASVDGWDLYGESTEKWALVVAATANALQWERNLRSRPKGANRRAPRSAVLYTVGDCSPRKLFGLIVLANRS